MHKTPYFQTALLLLTFIALLHISAIEFYFYWVLPWLDIVLHFLGGLWVGLVALWFVYFSGWWSKPVAINVSALVGISLAAALGVGLAWEVFEYVAGIIVTPEGYWVDTITDLLMDLVGGVGAAIYVWLTYQRNESALQRSYDSDTDVPRRRR